MDFYSGRQRAGDEEGEPKQPGIVEGVCVLAGGWNEVAFKVPSNPNPCGIL